MTNRNGRLKRIGALSTFILSFAFVIKIVVDAIYKTASQGVSALMLLQFLVCSIIISFTGFILFVYVQYKIENKRSVLSCTYNPRFMCCLLNQGTPDNFYSNGLELLNDIELAKVERQVDTKEIWLLSPDFSAEEGDNVFREVVRTRLNEGVHYSFVALNCPIAQERAKKIKDQYYSFYTKRRIHFYLIDGNEYALFLSLYSLVIYNPSKPKNTEAYVCVGETEGCETSVYAKLHKNHTQTATSITREIIKNTQEFQPM